jgi:diadenylate cyclase
MVTHRDNDELEILRRFAPGKPIREAVELIIRQGSGAIVVIGSGPKVDHVCSGGFLLDGARFTAQRLAELAKMDGGIVIDDEAELILRANVHFLPNPSIATAETGTRHRTAERMALETGRPVLSISDDRSMATVYTDRGRYELQSPTALLAEANQILNSLERLRRRLDAAERRMTRLEVDDVVVVRDVVLLLQRSELVRRLGAELERLAVKLGGEAKLIRLQAADLLEGVDQLAELVYADYAKRRPRRSDSILGRLDGLSSEALYDAATVSGGLGFDALDSAVRPRGIRALARVPRLPEAIRSELVKRFRDFRALLAAPPSDFESVGGIGRARAEQLRSYFDRLLEMGTALELHDESASS